VRDQRLAVIASAVTSISRAASRPTGGTDGAMRRLSPSLVGLLDRGFMWSLGLESRRHRDDDGAQRKVPNGPSR